MRYYKGYIALSDACDVPVLLHVRNARAICFDQLLELISLEMVAALSRSLRWRVARLEKAGLIARMEKYRYLGKPVIGCINGFALGGGCEIAMACTMRIASENAKLGQPEVKLGIIPGYGGTQRLPRLVGTGLAMQILLTGEMITAQEAHRIRLVNEVVPADRLIPRAEEIAQKIIGMAPLAIQYCMEAVNQGMNMTLPEGLFLEATLFGICCATEDKKEGTTAFLEKRAANFQGK